MITLLIFTLGFLAGVMVTGCIVAYQIYKISKKIENGLNDDLKKAGTKLEQIAAVKHLFIEINNITDEQMLLINQVDRPSAGASHSIWKNEIIQRVKELEEQKLSIFKTILASGVDPLITMYVGGEPKQMKMSEAVEIRESQLEKTPKTLHSKTESKNSRGNSSHLTLVSNEEKIDESNPGNSTVH